MRSAIIVLLALASLALAVDLSFVDLKAPAINHDLIDEINSDPDSTWKAGVNKRFEGKTLGDFVTLLGVVGNTKLPVKPAEISDAIPGSFDARTQWPGCIGPILDQGHCGSCWAFGAVESLQDRLCIFSKGKVNVSLSEQIVVSCDNENGGCDGGEPILAWQYLQQNGTVPTTCYPYAMGTCHHPGCSEWNTPSCNATCQDGTTFESAGFYYADSAYSVNASVPAIQTEILKNGPVEVVFAVYEDFANYKSGVYIHANASSPLLGYHAVKNIGWGVSNGVPYWIIQNSWNTDWGMNGFFWIRRGTDECGIEDGVVAGLPKVQ